MELVSFAVVFQNRIVMPNNQSMSATGHRTFDPLVESQAGVSRSLDAAEKFLTAAGDAFRRLFGSGDRPIGYRFVKYDNEPLNDRVSNPSLKGNVLTFELDGKERRFHIPEEKMEAMRQGYLPQNAFINRIVDKVDAMKEAQEAAAARYEAAQERHHYDSRHTLSMHM